MEERRKKTVRAGRIRQTPIRTEWNSRCVLFTYFQGDTNTVVDQHFSRALRNLKKTQRRRRSSNHSERASLRNSEPVESQEAPTERPASVLPAAASITPCQLQPAQPQLSEVEENRPLFTDSTMSPNQWHLSSPWINPLPEASYANWAISSPSISSSPIISNSPSSSTPSSTGLEEYGPNAVAQYPLSMFRTPSVHPQELWPYFPVARPDFLQHAYPHVFPDRHLVPEVYPDGRRDSLLSMLYEDRYVNRPLVPAARDIFNPARMAGNPGWLMNLPPIPEHYNIYGYGAANPNFDEERLQYPVRRGDFYFY